MQPLQRALMSEMDKTLYRMSRLQSQQESSPGGPASRAVSSAEGNGAKAGAAEESMHLSSQNSFGMNLDINVIIIDKNEGGKKGAKLAYSSGVPSDGNMASNRMPIEARYAAATSKGGARLL